MGSIIKANERDAQQTPIYDTYSIAAAASVPNTIPFFSSRTKGANGRQTTNLQQAGQIPNGQKFTVYGLGFGTLDTGLADVFSLMKLYTAVLTIGTKDYLEAPMEFFPAGVGITGFAATTVAATTVQATNNGTPNPAAVQMLSPENAIEIPGGVQFNVSLVGSAGFAAVANITLRCYLIGVWEKFVQ